MTAWYNEIDPQKAQWIRELIKAKMLADGEVDERDIKLVQAEDLRGFTQCHFFAGIAVWSYALRLAGWGDDRECWTGSCPCPSFSAAGKGAGFGDARHLWPHWFQLIRELRPATIFGEQVAAAIGHGWLDLVQTDLERADYAVGAAVLGACSVGAPHIRQRLYFCAHALRPARGGFTGSILGAEAASSGARFADGDLTDRSADYREALHGADALHPERWSVDGPGKNGRDGTDGRRQEARGIARARSQTGGGADSAGGRPTLWPGEAGDRRGACAAADRLCTPEFSADANQHGTERSGRSQFISHAGGKAGVTEHSKRTRLESGFLSPKLQETDVSTGRPSPTRGFWADCDWWYARDGKYRPIEPGVFPLAHGTSNRVLKLRGFGDAIVAPLAQAFIEAVMEVV